MPSTNLLIITGQEGSGKTTVSRELLVQTQNAARIDAEDLGQTNPWEMNDKFIRLLWMNVISLIENFAHAGFQNILAASFLSTKMELELFRKFLELDVNWFVIHLCASKEIRDIRRIERFKPTKKEWRDRVDKLYPEDGSLKSVDNYKYIRIENDNQSVEETIDSIKLALPEIYSK